MMNRVVRSVFLLIAGLGVGVAFGQGIPNGGAITNGLEWTAPEWATAWEDKADVASAALTGTPTVNAVPIPTFGKTQAEISAGVTPTNWGFAALNALRYGADPTGAADSTSAIQTAVNVARISGGTAYLPGGTYKTSAAVASGNYSVFVNGDGPGITVIQPTSSLGANPVLGFGGTNQGFSNLTINCANDTSCIGVLAGNNNGFYAHHFDIEQANFGMQLLGGAIEYVNNFQINRSGTIGIQVGVNSTNAPYSGDVYISDGVMSSVGYVQPSIGGIAVYSSGGLWVTNLDVLNQTNGFLCAPQTGSTVQFSFVDNVAFDTSAETGIAIQPNGGTCEGLDFTASWASTSSGNGIFIGPGTGTIDNVRLNGMRVFNNKGNGVAIVGASGLGLTGVSITNSDITGNSAGTIAWDSATQYSTGNTATKSGTYYRATAPSLNITPPNTSYWASYTNAQSSGIAVTGGASNFQINDNRIGPTAGQANTQQWAIYVAAGASNAYQIQNNTLAGSSGYISDNGTGVSKIVTGNLGYNPLGTTAISVTGGSPFIFTNTTGSTLGVAVTGGVITGIDVNGFAVPAVDGVWMIPQGGTLQVSYTSAPTMSYYGIN